VSDVGDSCAEFGTVIANVPWKLTHPSTVIREEFVVDEGILRVRVTLGLETEKLPRIAIGEPTEAFCPTTKLEFKFQTPPMHAAPGGNSTGYGGHPEARAALEFRVRTNLRS
jgi:hypothetical protein